MFPRLSAGSGVGGGWWAKSVVMENIVFIETTDYGYAGGQSRAKKPLVTRKSCVRSVVAWPDPGLERSCSTTALSSAGWLPARAAMSKGS